MKYVKVEWPEIQSYMIIPEFDKEVYFDPKNDCYFVPEDWTSVDYWEEMGGNIGDLDDATG